MKVSPEVRQKRKAEQLARLEVKNEPNYAELYASTPRQVRRHAEQQAQRAALRQVATAQQDGIAKDAEGAAEVFGGSIEASVAVNVGAGNAEAPEA